MYNRRWISKESEEFDSPYVPQTQYSVIKCNNVMEGNNVRTPQQQAELEKELFPILQGIINLVFPEGKIKMFELKEGKDKALKIHVDEIGSDEFLALASLAREKEAIVCLKRSGTGITIVISFNRPE